MLLKLKCASCPCILTTLYFQSSLRALHFTATGFDLIAADCLAMPLWIPLIYRGARATGLFCNNDAKLVGGTEEKLQLQLRPI